MPKPLVNTPTRRDALPALLDRAGRRPKNRRPLAPPEAAESAGPMRELTDLLGSFSEQTGALFE